MTIVIVNDFSYVDGGASQIAIHSAVGLKRAGHRVIFFTAKGPADSRLLENHVEIISTNQEEILYYKNKIIGAINGIWNRKAKYELGQLLDTLDPDDTIIHVHIWIKALSASIFAAIRQKKFKVVITAHDYFLACPNGGFYNYNKQKICPYKALSWQCFFSNCDKRNRTQKVYRFLRGIIQEKILSSCSVNIIFVSKFSKEILEKQLRFKHTSFLIRNIINPIPRHVAMKKNREYYIYIGRVSPEKGVDLFCEALSKLNLAGVVIGDGSSRASLEKRYASENNIKFVGWKSHDKMEEYLLQAKALIVPSKLYETAVLTIPEVQAYYPIPVVVGDKCAGKEYIEGMQNGFIFKSGVLESLINILQYIEDNIITDISRITINNAYYNLEMDYIKQVNTVFHMIKNMMYKRG